MPIPPIQCVKLRQRSMLLGTASTSVSIVDPVVVKPDTVSKKASTGELTTPPIRYGSIPHRDKAIQVSPVATSPSLDWSLFSLSVSRMSRAPATKHMAIGIVNGIRLSL